MKKFNKTIEIKVSVDAVAQQFLETIKEDEKHRELIAESVVGTLVNQGRLGELYNSLNGFTNEIDFKVGDVVNSTETYYNGDKHVEIESAEVIDIDLYRIDKLKLRYTRVRTSGDEQVETEWVSHTSCNKIPIDETNRFEEVNDAELASHETSKLAE